MSIRHEMDAWIQWNRDGFVAGAAGAVTTAFDQRLVRVHARGAWLVAVAEPLQRPNYRLKRNEKTPKKSLKLH